MYTHTHTHHKDLLLVAHTQTLHPLRPPCISLLGPLVPMAMCGQRCLGGGVGSRAEPPSLLRVPPGPVCTRTHTRNTVHHPDYSLTQPVNLQASIPAPRSLYSFASCRHHYPLFFLSFFLPVGLIWRFLCLYLIFHSKIKLKTYLRPCL